MPLAIYIHWPFCKAKCPYCDFNSHVREGVQQERWRQALLRELETMALCLPHHHAISIFFGGGTPSLMETETVAALIAQVKRLFPAPNVPEITLEANPTSTEAGAFRALRAAGVERVSLGVQSLRAEGLKFLGREHSAAEALRAVECAASIFPRYSFDLIYARPEQTTQDWEAELREALPYIGGHSSLYQLTIEEDTPFARFHAAGDFTLPEEEVCAQMYEQTAEILGEKNLAAYEISNYAHAGEECFHNLEIWRGTAYLGIGPGAHGRVRAHRPEGSTIPRLPFPPAPDFASAQLYAARTLKSPERWLAQVEACGHGLEEASAISDAERFEECLLMGLRLSEGIDLSVLPCPPRGEALLASATCQRLQESGVMEREGARLRVTPSGRLLLDYITRKLLTA